MNDLTNGRSAEGIVGDPELRRYWDSCCEHVKHDGAGRLWVNSSEGVSGFIDVYQLPLTHQSAPLETIWVKGKRLPVLGANETLSSIDGRIWGIAPAEGGKFLWISDTDNHRVIRIRDPLTDPVVDVILGQHTPGGDQCNRGRTVNEFAQRTDITPDMLCFPGNVALDRHGNLWVSDHALEVSGNYRLLMFSKSLFPDDPPSTIFAPQAARVFPRHGANQALGPLHDPRAPSNLIEERLGGPHPTATFEPAFDSRNRMVVGYNFYVGGRFVGIYDDPLEGATEPSGYLNDLASMPVAAAFDDDDNLYIGDHNRARVLVYRNPFNNTPTRKDDSRESVPAAPLPDYAANIDAIRPEPTACVLRDSARGIDSTLALTVSGLSEVREVEVEVRKIAAQDRVRAGADSIHVSPSGTRMMVSGIWSRLWEEYEATWATARLLKNGVPTTRWSTSFIIADDAVACNDVWIPPGDTIAAEDAFKPVFSQCWNGRGRSGGICFWRRRY